MFKKRMGLFSRAEKDGNFDAFFLSRDGCCVR